MTLSNPDPGASLAAMRGSQARLAKAADCPPERHLAFAGLLAALTAAPAAPALGMLAVELAVLAAVPLIVWWDKRRTGMFINGYKAGATRPVVLSLLAAQACIYLLSVWLSKERGLWPASLALAPVSFALGFFGSRLWMRVWRRDMGLPA